MTNPASRTASIRAFDELALTSLWGVSALFAVLAMFGLGLVFGLGGALLGNALTWLCVVGVFIHGIRYQVAELAARLIERRYKRVHGLKSSLAAAEGRPVPDESRPMLLRLTHSTDFDLIAQALLGVTVAFAMR